MIDLIIKEIKNEQRKLDSLNKELLQEVLALRDEKQVPYRYIQSKTKIYNAHKILHGKVISTLDAISKLYNAIEEYKYGKYKKYNN